MNISDVSTSIRQRIATNLNVHYEIVDSVIDALQEADAEEKRVERRLELRQKALAKLNSEEREALGLKDF